MSSQSIDLTGGSPPTGIPPPLVKREKALLPDAIPQKQSSEQNSYFLYQKECRLAWIKYLGLLGRVRLREGFDGLPFFYGMPPEVLTKQIDTGRIYMIQKAATSDPRNSLITLTTVLNSLRNRPQQSHIAWGVVQQKLANSRPQLHASSAMNRLVGIQTQEDDPPSCPGYVLPMASFERAVMNAQRTKDETQRRQWADMSLRSLRKFMDAQNNEAVIDKMIEFQKHYEALAALSSK
ncbi:hypothetical protein FGLOB1_36 [Fusarium globosum]|uniref:Uncharacterized protein n=1 Tax=Fusarium globosum TaxID=78864 RepID=A0A8H5Z2J2_9HYPO|nr:hypothetical protein FGLOB1_36 [Fusarium globosum]